MTALPMTMSASTTRPRRELVYEGPASMREPRGFAWLKANGLIRGMERDEHVRIYRLSR